MNKASHNHNIRDGCPIFDVLLSHDISNYSFQSHTYLPLPHTRHPINTNINTTPGSQTQ